MALSKDTSLEILVVAKNSLPVKASTRLYQGGVVCEDGTTGYGAKTPAAANAFAGFALGPADNSGGAAGAIRVEVCADGEAVLAVSGASAVTDFGRDVFAVDDGTFALVSGGAGTKIGKVTQWLTGNKCRVKFQAVAYRSI